MVEQLPEDGTEARLRAVCEKARDAKLDELSLVFNDRVKLTPQLSAIIVEVLGSAAVTKLHLIQKSPSIGFFTSSVQLRMPKVVVTSHRELPA